MTAYDPESVAKLMGKLNQAERAIALWFCICLMEAALLVGFSFFSYYDRESIKSEAVKRGYAEWTPASPGQMPVVFKWKDKP